ncbi:TetR/AcrR family transcriptional regulator [Kitasatospora sp. MAP5-34]|uniref:TetR/AcrR family transcriptional regulator n=1 Tax=Kitasatospora sp. MAP5-34 TaxID=3035102 RepID=UPI002475F7C0|nr:TetR/AcrR family transcriptional regulator [Kitasatospora sp. MAP5-34]MDH6576919.1 AcrR family transcriptional regulator [Kitasatospora sp. MAP5-34]
MTATQAPTGRTNQKLRTRTAIVEATRELIRSGHEVTMPEVARAALVSEATAYRYFPDLVSLLTEAMVGLWPSPADALEPVAGSDDPVERIAFACEFLLRGVLAYQGAVRAMISTTITRPELAATRPGIRFGLIDHALAPLADTLATAAPEAFAQLQRDLAVVMSAEAIFCLTDLCRLGPDEAVASAVRTASTLTQAALRAATTTGTTTGTPC